MKDKLTFVFRVWREFFHALRGPVVIQMADGSYFNFRKFNPEDFNIRNIASSLSKLCRFTGHTERFYSVAQHSVVVSYLVPEEFALEALLHDREEAFVGDMSTPLKRLNPMYRLKAEQIRRVSARAFGIPEEESPIVKKADHSALLLEKRYVMPRSASDRKHWAPYVDIVYPKIEPLNPDDAEKLFLNRYRELTGKHLETFMYSFEDNLVKAMNRSKAIIKHRRK